MSGVHLGARGVMTDLAFRNGALISFGISEGAGDDTASVAAETRCGAVSMSLSWD